MCKQFKKAYSNFQFKKTCLKFIPKQTKNTPQANFWNISSDDCKRVQADCESYQ